MIIRNRRGMRATAALALVIALTFAVSVLTGPPTPAAAASAADFNPGAIISDTHFYDSNGMSEAEIQSFLVSKGSVLSSYRGDVASRARLVSDTTGNVRCEAFQGGQNLAASTIIFRAQTACGINAKVILVTLQKEQGLIGSPSATPAALDRAMGFACPDTAPCAAYALGFGNQVYMGTLQLITYKASRFGMQPGWHSIKFNPNADCGASDIYISNYATAALYNYTPYQPNASALRNLYSTGDACGSYGNRNFFVFYSDWFGSPLGAVNPVGVLDSVSALPGNVRVTGWVFDPDTTDSTAVHVYVNGIGRAFTAGNSRPDVDVAYGGVGEFHGFDVTVPVVSAGAQEVCVYGINVGPGTNVQLGGGCRSVTVQSGSPVGIVDSVVAAGGAITTTGWALDPDTVKSIPVHVYVDSAGLAYAADQNRPDIAAAYPGYGSAHGYSTSVKASPGLHTVCVYGINSGPGANSLRGCKEVTVASGAPYGVLDSVVLSPGKITVTGWTFDPDSTDSIPVHVYMGSTGFAFTANKPRPDVAQVYPGYGVAHGFAETIAAAPGPQTICVYGIEIAAPGANKSLGCRTVVAMSGPPVGVVDSVAVVDGQIAVKGWAFDPDTSDPIAVRIAVDSVETTVLADQSRPDIAAAYPAYGSLHGYSQSVSATPGRHTVCVYAVNSGPGADSLRGCKDVTL